MTGSQRAKGHLAVESDRDDTKMKQPKMCRGSHFVILLTIMLSGCGNKGPLVQADTVINPVTPPSAATPTDETEQKETEQ